MKESPDTEWRSAVKKLCDQVEYLEFVYLYAADPRNRYEKLPEPEKIMREIGDNIIRVHQLMELGP